MAVVNDKKKEPHHYKKKVSSLKKTLEALEAQAHEQEIEIDNLRFVLTRTLDEVVEWYKAFIEYAKDIEASVE